MIGWTELIYGSMYCGKSEELIRRLKRVGYAGQKFILFKPAIDDRYELTKVLTHESNKAKKVIMDLLKKHDYDIHQGSLIRIIMDNLAGSLDAFPVATPQEILELVTDDIDVVGIDEVQFFSADLIPVIKELNNRGKRVIMAGLDLYASGEPFGIVNDLACISKYVDKLHAVCVDCGSDAYISYKVANEVGNKESQVDVGSTGKYIALCEKCSYKREMERNGEL
jgi:thymidine kinase